MVIMELENKMKLLLRLLVAIAIVLPYVKANESDECNIIGIKFFSSDQRNKFYHCDGTTKYAVLKECPIGQFYWPQREKCFPDQQKPVFKPGVAYSFISRGSKPEEQPRRMTRKLLRSGVRLGDLYDAQQDQFLSGTSLWSAQELKKVKLDNRQIQQSTDLKFSNGKTTLDRLSLMDINAELKLSFLGGLIQVTGSASFVRDSNVLSTDETFTLAFLSTAYSDVIPTSTTVTYPEVCNHKATHVVNKIVYGQNAYFFFKHSKQSSDEKQDVGGSLQAVVKSIPGFSIEGSASVKLTGEEKKLADSTEVRFNGDFSLKNGFPTNFDTAITAFKELSNSIATGPDFNGAVPVEIELTPIKEFCSSADNILVNIGDSVMEKVSEMLMDLQGLDTYIRTLLGTIPAKIYPAVRSNLNLYKTHLADNELKIKEKLQELLPAVKGRTNGKSEKDLIDLIKDYNLSPFNNIESRLFLDSRNLEIKALNVLMKDLDTSIQDNFEIADYKEPNKAALLLKYPKIVQFSVNILQSKEVTQSFLSEGNSTNSTFWYNDDAKASNLGRQKRLFKNFVAVNKDSKKVGYLISLNVRNEIQPVEMNAKVHGNKFGDDFIIPDYPEKPKLFGRTDNKFTVGVNNPNNTWITKFYINYWRLIDGEKEHVKKEFVFSGPGITNATITNLSPLTTYEYKVVHFTEFGVSPSSEMGQVTTTPCSEPKNVRLGTATESSLEILWNIPVCGKGIQINRYEVILRDSKNNAISIKTFNASSSPLKSLFLNLRPSTIYEVSVEAVVILDEVDKTTNETKEIVHKSLPTTLTCHTSPKPPHSLRLVKVGYSNVSFTWSAPNTGNGERIVEYLVKYNTMDTDGSKSVQGTEKIQSALTKTYFEITGLTMGIVYGFSVKVITTFGESKYSQTLLAKTLYEQSDIDRLRDTLRQSFDAEIKKIQNKTDKSFIKMDKLHQSFDQSINNVSHTLLEMLNERTSMKAIAKRFKLEEFFIGSKPYYISTVARTYNDARSYCQNIGGDLAAIEDSAHESEVYKYMRELGVNYVYIGYNDIKSEGSFEWYYPQQINLQNQGYTNWHRGEPDNFGNDEDCACIDLYSKGWYDEYCDYKKNFICGIPS